MSCFLIHQSSFFHRTACTLDVRADRATVDVPLAVFRMRGSKPEHRSVL